MSGKIAAFPRRVDRLCAGMSVNPSAVAIALAAALVAMGGIRSSEITADQGETPFATYSAMSAENLMFDCWAYD